MTEHAPLPDSERIRREALQRSWQRDKEVGARRLRIRWAIWALCRYGLPLFFVLGTAVAVWIWGLPQLRTTLATLTGPVASPTGTIQQSSAPPAPIEPPAVLLLPPLEEPVHSEAAPTPPEPVDGEQEPIKLRPDAGFPTSDAGGQYPASPEGTDSTTTPTPVLKPDIGTHHQEP